MLQAVIVFSVAFSVTTNFTALRECPITYLVSSAGTGFSYLNSTSTLNTLALARTSDSPLMIICDSSSVTITSSEICALPYQSVPFTLSGKLHLSSITLTVPKGTLKHLPALVNHSYAFSDTPYQSLSVIDVADSSFSDLLIDAHTGPFVSCGTGTMQRISDTIFRNISLSDTPSNPDSQTASFRNRLDTAIEECEVSRSTVIHCSDTVHGLLFTGVSDKTTSSFKCFNTTFSSCRRDRFPFSLRTQMIASQLNNYLNAESNESCSSANVSDCTYSSRVTQSCSCQFEHCIFTHCSSSSNGGALFVSTSSGEYVTCSIIDTSFSYNYCDGNADGGCLYCSHAYLVVLSSSFHNSSSNQSGGAISFGWNSYISLSLCNFTGCSASLNGGSLYFNSPSPSTPTIFLSRFVSCSAKHGGALYSSIGCSFVSCFVDDCISTDGSCPLYCSPDVSSFVDTNFPSCATEVPKQKMSAGDIVLLAFFAACVGGPVVMMAVSVLCIIGFGVFECLQRRCGKAPPESQTDSNESNTNSVNASRSADPSRRDPETDGARNETQHKDEELTPLIATERNDDGDDNRPTSPPTRMMHQTPDAFPPQTETELSPVE